jgi:hypothetical protein
LDVRARGDFWHRCGEERPRQESNPVRNLRKVACHPSHAEDRREEQGCSDSNRKPRFWRPRCCRYTTPLYEIAGHAGHRILGIGCLGGIEPASSTFTGSHACQYTTNTIRDRLLIPSTPTRIRTRNPSLEARDDPPFHHRGSLLGVGGPVPVLHRRVDPPGLEPGSPACRAGVFPLDDEPFSGLGWN